MNTSKYFHRTLAPDEFWLTLKYFLHLFTQSDDVLSLEWELIVLRRLPFFGKQQFLEERVCQVIIVLLVVHLLWILEPKA